MFKFRKGKPKKFLSEKDHERNLASQISMTPQTVQQLREYDVTEDKSLKLEYFFYTNTPEKASALNSVLKNMSYDSDFDQTSGDAKLQIVTGWTSPILMTEKTVVEWTEKMCNVGYEYDVEFDGWGTNPEQ
jgi:hypothetical protein